MGVSTNQEGGHKLRQIREARLMTQMDVERATANHFGVEARVVSQQVSRIEKGLFDKPPILDLLRIGEVLGLQPDDIAEIFQLWPRQTTEGSKLDPTIQELADLSEQVPAHIRDDMMAQLKVIVALTRAALRKEVNEREDAGDPPAPPKRPRATQTNGAPNK